MSHELAQGVNLLPGMGGIPSVTVCDVYAPRKEGGAKWVVVIASPLGSDDRSLGRLMKKIEHYLGFIASEKFSMECGAPSPKNTVIEVFIHPDSAGAAFDLLERSRDWVSDNRARLVVRKEANSEGSAASERAAGSRLSKPVSSE